MPLWGPYAHVHQTQHADVKVLIENRKRLREAVNELCLVVDRIAEEIEGETTDD